MKLILTLLLSEIIIFYLTTRNVYEFLTDNSLIDINFTK